MDSDVQDVDFRNAFFPSPSNLGSELESAMELEEGGLTSLPEEVNPFESVHEGRDRSRKVTMLDRAGPRFLESSRSPFRHSFVDVRVFDVL